MATSNSTPIYTNLTDATTSCEEIVEPIIPTAITPIVVIATESGG